MIKEIRIQNLKMTQRQLAKELNMTQANLSRIEAGKQRIPAVTARLMEELTGQKDLKAKLCPAAFA